MFDNVSDAYLAAGKKMDNWTLTKFQGLRDTYKQYGKLSDGQIELLNSLPKYIAKSPFISQADNKLKEEVEFTKQSMKQFEVETTPDAEWVREFERKLLTSYVPMLEDLIKYFKLKQVQYPSIKIPNNLKPYFELP